MPNQTIQYPNIDLPGAEYFSLAPNRTVAIQGRRRARIPVTLTPAPAATDSINSIVTTTLETNFLPTSAIYLHHFFANFTSDGAGLQVNNVFAGLSLIDSGPSLGFPEFPLGSPTLTNPSLAIGTNLLTDRDRFITYKDIAIGGTVAPGNTLLVQLQLNVNNPTDAVINFSVFGTIIYSRLDGVLE